MALAKQIATVAIIVTTIVYLPKFVDVLGGGR